MKPNPLSAAHASSQHTAHGDFVAQIGAAYLARAEQPDEAQLSRWQPAGWTWPLLRQVQHRALGMKRCEAEVEGRRLVWIEGGPADGAPVLLLHGFSSFKENWLFLAPFLLGRHRVYALDLPGWGESEFRYGDAYTLDHQVGRVAAWIEAHVGAPMHVVGNSMGGAIAGLLAARHPGDVASLTLMNAAGLPGSQASPLERRLLEGSNSLIVGNLGQTMRLFEDMVGARRKPLALLLAPLLYREFSHRRSVNLHMFAQMLEQDPSLPGFDAVRAPTLVLWGDEDRILDASCAQTFGQVIPGARVRVLRGVGHLPMLEVPAVTARGLRHFWKQAAAGAVHG